MPTIPLTKGYFATVDAEDYERISKYRWCANKGKNNKTPYAVRGVRVNGKQRRIFMHRTIAGATAGEYVDHINHNTLDNRQCNLRVGTQRDNMLNRCATQGRGYKGVSPYKPNGTYVAHYCRDHIGYYDTPEQAALAYNAYAYAKDGDKVLLNDVLGVDVRTEARKYDKYVYGKQLTSKYRGVDMRPNGTYRASIQHNNNRKYIGTFATERAAVQAYNEACAILGCARRAQIYTGGSR